MKKIIVVCCLLLVTGCKNNLTCKKSIEDDMYKTEEELIFNFDDADKLTGVSSKNVMIFETEEMAKNYFSVFESMLKDSDIELDKNEIIIKVEKNYEVYEGDKTSLKEKMEKDGYSCKE